METNNKKDATQTIYIVLTQTGAILSKILKVVTRAKYNHSSISLTDDLSTMYSFGRLKPRNPFIGGFVKEAPGYGTFLRFPQTEALVIAVDITDKQYREINEYLAKMYESKDEYTYNYKGLFLAMFGIARHNEKQFYCSEFVKDVLVKFEVVPKGVFLDIVKPVDILDAIDGHVIYTGKLKDYTCA